MNYSRRIPLAPVIIGSLATVLLVGGLGVWAVGTQISGAVVASGSIQVENESQIVQHPDGGVVNEILARNGDEVSAGDILVRLDGTFQRSELTVVEGQIAELYARKLRFRAERDGTNVSYTEEEFPRLDLLSRNAILEQISGQMALFEARQTSLQREREQLAKQQRQLQQKIDGLNAQLNGTRRQLELSRNELSDLQTLFDKGLVQVTRLLDLQRTEASLEGQIGALVSQIAEAETRISEIELQRLRLADARHEQAIAELRDLAVSEKELNERRSSLIEQLGRLDIVAPVNGTVFGSKVLADRSVLQSAEPILYIVPRDQPLRVSAKINPIDVDQVYAGQQVILNFSAFNRRTTPEGAGVIRYVSADATTDPNTGMKFYEAIVTIDSATNEALDGLELVPGMPVETYIRTSDRTPLSYLIQPISVYFSRAFRED